MSRLKKIEAYDFLTTKYVSDAVDVISKNVIYPAIQRTLQEKCSKIGIDYDSGMDELIINNPALTNILKEMGDNIEMQIDNILLNIVPEVTDEWEKDTKQNYSNEF